MKILVTGGAGFIGSHLCEELSKTNGFEVFSLDNYSTGLVENHVEGVTYIRGDTIDIDRLVPFSPDLIYHLGEYSRVEQSFDDMDLVWRANKQGTFKVLQFCLKHACKLVYAGSSTKFGDGGLGRTQSPYAWTKASNTELICNYSSWYNLSYAITYFYNAYGKREISQGKYATLIGLFAEKMRQGEKLTIVKPGTQKRNFTHIDDIISGLMIVGKHGHGDEFGIGSPEAYSITEVAELFGGEVELIDERRGNRMLGDIVTKKTEALGWRANKDLVQHIEALRKKNWMTS
jgi:UDP-glucose 4-epimerase